MSRVSNVNHCQRELDWRRDQPYARTHRARDTQNMYETRSEPHGTTADERVGLRSLPPPLLEQYSKSERARRALERVACHAVAPRGKGGRGRGSRSGVRGDAGEAWRGQRSTKRGRDGARSAGGVTAVGEG